MGTNSTIELKDIISLKQQLVLGESGLVGGNHIGGGGGGWGDANFLSVWIPPDPHTRFNPENKT